jgi:hypothetical protein
MTVRNTGLKNGSPVTWIQYRSTTERRDGRTRTGCFWSLAPGPAAIWVRPDAPESGEPSAIKVYRRLRSGGLTVEAVAFDDDLTAVAA